GCAPLITAGGVAFDVRTSGAGAGSFCVCCFGGGWFASMVAGFAAGAGFGGATVAGFGFGPLAGFLSSPIPIHLPTVAPGRPIVVSGLVRKLPDPLVGAAAGRESAAARLITPDEAASAGAPCFG